MRYTAQTVARWQRRNHFYAEPTPVADLPDRDYPLTYVGGADPNTSDYPPHNGMRGLVWGLIFETAATVGLLLLWILWYYVKKHP